MWLVCTYVGRYEATEIKFILPVGTGQKMRYLSRLGSKQVYLKERI